MAGLLLTPWQEPNNTSLAQIVLQGLGLMQNNIKTNEQIAQAEMENYDAQSKQAASNLINLANIQAKQREFTLDQQMTASNIDLNRAKMAYYLGLGRGGNVGQPGNLLGAPGSVSVVSGNPDDTPGETPSIPSPSAAPSSLLTTQSAPPADMAPPNGAPGGSPFNTPGLLPLPQPAIDRQANLLTAGMMAGLGTGGMAAAPLLMQQPASTPAPTPAPIAPAADARQSYDDLLKLRNDSVAAFKSANGFDYEDALKMNTTATDQQAKDAEEIHRLDNQLADAKNAGTDTSAPAPSVASADPKAKTVTGSAFDWSNIKDGQSVKRVSNDGTFADIRTKSDGVQLQQRVEIQNGKVHYGPQQVIMPSKITQAPMQVQLPKDKVQAYDTAKFWLEKIYPKMDAKSAAANRDQAMQMHNLMVQLGNDPDVQKHLMTMGQKDMVPPPGMEIAGYNPDMKDNTQVPFFRKIKPEDDKAKKDRDATIRNLWSDFNNELKTADSSSTNITDAQKKAAKVKAQSILQSIQQLAGTETLKPGQQPTTGPGSAAYYYGGQ